MPGGLIPGGPTTAGVMVNGVDGLVLIGYDQASSVANGGVRAPVLAIHSQIDLAVGEIAEVVAVCVMAASGDHGVGASGDSLGAKRLGREAGRDLGGQHSPEVVFGGRPIYDQEACGPRREGELPAVGARFSGVRSDLQR